MKSLWAYNLMAIGFIVVLGGVLGTVWVVSRPQPVDAVPAAVSAAPAQAPVRPSEPAVEAPAVLSPGDALLAEVMKIEPANRQLFSDAAESLYGATDALGDVVQPAQTAYTPSASPAPATMASSSSSAASASSGSSGSDSSGTVSGSTLSSASGGASGGSADASADAAATETESAPTATAPTTPTSTGGGMGGSAIGFINDISVTVLSGMEKLLRDDLSAPGTSSAQIYSAKNETEAFQILVTNESNYTLPDIEIHVSDWQGPAGAKPKLTLFRAHYVKTTSPSYGLPADTPVGWYPDALIPFVDPYTGREITSGLYRADHTPVNSRQNQSYWADVRVDSDVRAGTYTCSMLVTSSGRSVAEVPVTLTVWDFELPKQRQFTTWYYGFYDIHQYYGIQRPGGDHYQVLYERYRDMAYDHGVYPVPQWVGSNGSRDAATGTVTFDAAYLRQMRAFVTRYGKGIIQIPPSYYQSDSENFVLFDETKFKNTIRSFETLSQNYPEFGQFVVYMDEPYKPHEAAAVRQAKIWMNEIPAARVKMMVTGEQYAFDILDSQDNQCADLWVSYGQGIMERHTRWPQTYRSMEDLADSFLNDPDKPNAVLWTDSAHPRLDASLASYRDFAWFGYTFGATGGFGWQLTVPSTRSIDPWTEPRTFRYPEGHENAHLVYNGMTSHIYPGNSARVGFAGVGAPVATMRLKTWRRACQDFEYFKMLEELTEKATVEEIVSNVVDGYYTCPDPADYKAARKTIAELILENQ